MKKSEINRSNLNHSEPWAILPFDEEEDAERWSKLMAATDQLIRDTLQFETETNRVIKMDESIQPLKNVKSRQTYLTEEDEIFLF